MISNVNLRPYEVSIWTLQDSFITILKHPYLENKGTIENAKANIKDDGTQELTFSLPMYLFDNTTNQRYENPIWYTTKDGTLVTDMRKVKVIINKRQQNERVYEFVITEIELKHETDNLYCEVSCEGLAFQELGKKGYRISLTSDDFNAEDWDYYNKTKDANGNLLVTQAPHATLQYWNDRVFKNNPQWTYEIQMDWSAYSTYGVARSSNKVYEDEYVSAWNDALTPKTVEAYKEKERLVDLEESNIYNITQDLAEAFGVFCKYEYEYNDDYSICGRKVIYYNNFLHEKAGALDITYPYSTSKVRRNIDSTDLITKMYVEPVSNTSSESGYTNIMTVGANRTGEDYLLDFEYLYSIGAIEKEQYDGITTFEKAIRKINDALTPLEAQIISLSSQVPELEAKVDFHTSSIQLDKERWSAVDDLLNNLTGGTGTLEVTAAKPETGVMLQDSRDTTGNSYYIKITKLGVLKDTVKLYTSYDYRNQTLTGQISAGHFEDDEFGNLVQITNLYPITDSDGKVISRTVYMTYSYNPELYYEKVRQTWIDRQGVDEAALKQAQDDLDAVNTELATKLAAQEDYLAQKQALIRNFELLMGPALREGHWTPDGYDDYGDRYSCDFVVDYGTDASAQNVTAGLASFIWDDKLFDNEIPAYEERTVSQTKTPLWYVELTSAQLTWLRTDEHYKLASIIFYDSGVANNRTLATISLGSQAHLVFIKDTDNVRHAAIIVDNASGYTPIDSSVPWYCKNAKLGIVSTELENNEIVTKITSSVNISDSSWKRNVLVNTVYPRIQIQSMSMKNGDHDLSVIYDGEPLVEYEDFTLFSRNGSYYVTIKPEVAVLYPSGKKIVVRYTISNADTAIYLDAVEVIRENSQPKVSYEVDVDVANPNIVADDYEYLGYICNINDTELKFENVRGYISELDLDLDHPWQDKIMIKNYKTKFEDLFSKIVASSEEMKKSEFTIDLASKAFLPDGEIDGEIFANSFQRADLNYAFNNGNLTINEKDGIWGVSDSGVVAFRGGGIFTANQRDVNGNWVWNTGITPQGVDAGVITTGQLDTNRIKIYAGDKVRFQFNSDGLYAYKTLIDDANLIDWDNVTEETTAYLSGLSAAGSEMPQDQYVRFYEQGLFLVAEGGTHVLNKDRTGYTIIKEPVDRVEISWEGLKLRDWSNNVRFWADPDTGNLTLWGRIQATEGWFGSEDSGWIIKGGSIETINFGHTKSDGSSDGTGIQLIGGSDPAIILKRNGIDKFFIKTNVNNPTDSVFYVGDGDSSYMQFAEDTNGGKLTVRGVIEALAGHIGESGDSHGWDIIGTKIQTSGYDSPYDSTTQTGGMGIKLEGGATPMLQLKKKGDVFYQFNGSPSNGFYFFIGADIDSYSSAYASGGVPKVIDALDSSENVKAYMGFSDDGLYIRGNITATSIMAVTGNIGGWVIKNDRLTSAKGDIQLISGSGSAKAAVKIGDSFAVTEDGLATLNAVNVGGQTVDLAGKQTYTV